MLANYTSYTSPGSAPDKNPLACIRNILYTAKYLPLEAIVTLFDLLFLASALAAIASVVTAALFAVSGRGERALSVLKRLGMATLGYAALLVIVAAATPQKVLQPGDPWCFDDWCLSVEGVTQMPSPVGTHYTVSLRIYSEAKRVSQRAKGAWIYLIDRGGTRYSPLPDNSQTALDVLLQPGESIQTSRTFLVPNGVHDLGLITGHGGGYCSMLPPIIGEGGCLFNKPTMIRIE
jgi:hypothetical protein